MNLEKRPEAILKQIYSDDILLPAFMEECQRRGYLNNKSIKDLKFDYFEHIAYFGYVVNDKIREFSGVHNFDINGQRYYRVGFRGISLRDKEYCNFKIGRSFKTSFNWNIIFPICMLYIQRKYGEQKFVITANTEYSETSKSHIVNRLLSRNQKGTELLFKDIIYLNTKQNVWLLDHNFFISNFKENYEKNLNVEIQL